MSYLLDTNVVSELVRPRPDPRVVEWLNAAPNVSLHVSVLSVGEIRRGIEELSAGPRKARLLVWLEKDLADWFEDRMLPVTRLVAERWGRLVAEVRRPVPAVDSLLAATALHHGLTVVTRNVDDFRFPSLVVVNPWSS